MTYKVKKNITQTNLLKTNTIDFLLRGYRLSALFLELARTVLFLSSSPQTFRLRIVLAPHGEAAKTLPMVRLATLKLIVSIAAVVGV